ncbi:hypothetical protein ACMG4P_22575 [Pseudovibrio denitrificans]|uniref:hypothetical protein n=1 Tax=Pseudovibrio denitrificans TaxID=258256 RepID=UPI0039BF9AD3
MFELGEPIWRSPIVILDEISLPKPSRFLKRQFSVDGIRYEANVASWSLYIPELQLKLLHSFDGHCHCISKGAPSRTDILDGRNVLSTDRYTVNDWQSVYKKTVSRRTAEIFVNAVRLQNAGIRPKVLDVAFVRTFNAFHNNNPTWTCGLIVENLYKYPRKVQSTLQDLEHAGVIPDRINSCVRQQIHGYVSDLNSVIGVMPTNADKDICELSSELKNEIHATLHQHDQYV